MSTTNIKVNYLILEQILRLMGYYKWLCLEYGGLDEVFQQAKTGKIRFDMDILSDELAELTGVDKLFWDGSKRLKLGIRCTCSALQRNGITIDNIDLSNDKLVNETYVKNSNTYVRRINIGKNYRALSKNPLQINRNKIAQTPKNVKVIKSLYSLRGLLTILLINLDDNENICLIDRRNTYKHTNWEQFMKPDKKTADGISYCPKYIEFRKGTVQTIIKSLDELGIYYKYSDVFPRIGAQTE